MKFPSLDNLTLVNGTRSLPGYLPWLLLLVIFVADRFTQLGFAHGMLYAPLILVALFTRRTTAVLAIAASAVVLTIIGLFISPPQPQGFDILYVLLNRFFAIVCIGVSALLCVSMLRNTAR